MSESLIEFTVLKDSGPRSGMTCVSIVRNERYFVPHLLRHYRTLGVARFVIYDDGSTDGTREYLMSQDDCMVITSGHDFHQIMPDGRPFQYHARTGIAERFCTGQWHLVVDADEFLFLPSRYSSIREVVGDLEARGKLCALAAMVDFYPATLGERNFSRELGPLARRPWWFDREAGFVRNPYTDIVEARPGGVRARLLKLLGTKHPEILQSIFPRETAFSKLWKTPLLKAGEGIAHRDAHSLTVTPPVELQLALAHFKFYPGLDQKIADALQRRSYWNASREYQFLAAAVEHLEKEALVSHRSVEFAGASSIEKAGLMFSRAPRPRSAPARTTEVFGAPLTYERLPQADGQGELELTIRGEYEKALKAGFPEGKAWATDLADRRFQWALLEQILRAAARAARPDPAAKGRKGHSPSNWTVGALAVVLPPGGASVRLKTKGLWTAVHHLRVESNRGGEVALVDGRGDEPGPPSKVSLPSAAGLQILFPSSWAATILPWQGKGLKISIVLQLTPKA